MRVAVFIASILMMARPSEASESCMAKAQARQHFGSVHIYWHGADHCWDASPGRRHRHVVHNVAPKPDQPKWRDAMSAMVPEPDTNVVQMTWLDRWVDVKPSELSLVAGRVVIPQATPLTAEPVPLVLVVLLTLSTIALTLAIIVILPQGSNYRRQSG